MHSKVSVSPRPDQHLRRRPHQCRPRSCGQCGRGRRDWERSLQSAEGHLAAARAPTCLGERAHWFMCRHRRLGRSLKHWDVPIGVCQTNGLLRVTEVKDTAGFETPFLLPVSFQELVGMVIDYDREEVRTRQGRSTPMQRLPSGHRAISVIEFNGPWQLPRELQHGGKDPFQVPRLLRPPAKSAGPVQKHRGVTVWLRQPSGNMREVGVLEGPRHTMVVPSECLSTDMQALLEPTRVTFFDALPDQLPYVINDVWQGSLGSRQLESPWTGTVVFQQTSTPPSASTASPTSLCATPGQVSAPSTATGASQAPQHFSLQDSSDASAVHDLEGVFSSIGEDGVFDVDVHPPNQPSSWQRVRAKCSRLFAVLSEEAHREVPRRSVNFMAWAQNQSNQASMLSGLARIFFVTSCHAAASARACARRAGAGPTASAPSWFGLVSASLGPSGSSHRQDDCHGPRPDGDRRLDGRPNADYGFK